MQREGSRACLDEPRADVQAHARPVLDTATHLDADRHRDRRRHRVGDPACEVGVVEQVRAGPGLRHLADGTAEVHVDDVRTGRFDHPGCVGHHRRLGAEDLDRQGVLVGGDPQVAERLLVPVLDPGAGDHLRAHEPGPVAAALPAERLDPDAGHRREHDPARDLDLADPPGFTQIYRHPRHRSPPLLTCIPGRRYHPHPPEAGCRPAISVSGSFRRTAALKEVILTPEGHKKLQEEIEYLSTDKRREIADRIREAREFGDIAENAEYDSAKNEQAHLEARIALLEERLKSSRVVTKKEIKSGEVSVGTKVRLRDVKANKTVEYHIVGSAEANPAENKLSNESPVGKAIMGRKKGDVVEVAAPRGTLKFKIMDIKAA